MFLLRNLIVITLLALASASGRAQILIGQTAGFTGPVASGVQETTEGAKLWFDATNARGGVNGQKIELISLDDKFEPALAAENARSLIEKHKVVAMFLTRGTPHTEAIMPLLVQHAVPLVGPSTGAMVMNAPTKKYIFNVRSPYQAEAAKSIALLATVGLNRIAVAQVDDSFGNDVIQGVERGFADRKLQPLFIERFDRTKPEFGKMAQRVVTEQAQAVLFIGSAAAVAQGTIDVRRAGSRATLVTLSNNASSGFIKLMGEHAHGFVVTQVFPGERAMGVPMIREANDLLRAKGGSQLSPAMVEGYAAAKVLVEALKRAGRNPTRESVQKALEGMSQFDLGGIEVRYSPTNHAGVGFTDLSIVDANGSFRR